MQAKRWIRYQYGRQYMRDVVLPAFDNLHIEKRLHDCGQVVNSINCCSCGTKHFSSFNRCKSRWCVVCSHVKLLSWVARLVPVMKNWLEEGKYINMVNFTIRDGECLKERIDYLEECYRAVYNNGASGRKEWKRRFPAGFKSVEVKIGAGSGKWHPHIHTMVFKDHYEKDYDWLKEKWKNATDDSGSVWLKGVNKGNELRSCIEVAKYMLKAEKQLYDEPELLYEAWETLKGRRQVNTWGFIRGMDKQVEKDIECTDIKKLTDFVCQSCGCTAGELKSYLNNELNESTVLFDIIK